MTVDELIKALIALSHQSQLGGDTAVGFAVDGLPYQNVLHVKLESNTDGAYIVLLNLEE